MSFVKAAALILLVLGTFGVHGQTDESPEDGNPPNWCRNGHFPGYKTEFRVSRITGAKNSRSYFYKDGGKCPEGNDCREIAYVIAGDEVIIAKTYGEFSCAWFQPKKGNATVGWIKTVDLAGIEIVERDPKIDMWAGSWVYGSSNIEIRRARGNELLVSGNAFWHGFGDNIHIGEVAERGRPSGNRLKLGGADEYDCRVQMQLIGRYLIVSDNRQCGGVNVTFDGVYRKK